MEDALITRRKRNLQYKDKQLFNMNIGVTDTIDTFPDNQISSNFIYQEEPSRRPSGPSVEVLALLDQQRMDLRDEFSRMFEEYQRRTEQTQFINRRELNNKIEELKQILIQEMGKLNRHFGSQVSLSSNND